MNTNGVGILWQTSKQKICKIRTVKSTKLLRSRHFSVISKDKQKSDKFNEINSKFTQRRNLMMLNPTGKNIRVRSESIPSIPVKENKVEQLKEILKNLESQKVVENTAAPLTDEKVAVVTDAVDDLKLSEPTTKTTETIAQVLESTAAVIDEKVSSEAEPSENINAVETVAASDQVILDKAPDENKATKLTTDEEFLAKKKWSRRTKLYNQ